MKLTKITTAACIFLIISIFTLNVCAETAPGAIEKSSSALAKLQLMKGDEKGNLNLENKVTRCEFLTMIIRMMGFDKTVSTGDVEISFSDLKESHWAYNNIKIAVKTGLVKGYLDNTVGADNFVTYAEAQTMIIRALGYEKNLQGTWPQNILDKAVELGLNKSIDVPRDKELTRGEASILIYNSLPVKFN
jgi:hypothetical protein